MVVPGPSFVPLVDTGSLDDFFPDFEGLNAVKGGVAVFGPAAAYALVWELGSLRLKQPGPKTLWSVNRDGQAAILTKQAPLGYIGILSDQFYKIIEAELGSVEFKSNSAKGMRLELEVAIDNASQKIAALVKEYAPVDSGQLQDSIFMVDSDESDILGASNAVSSATLVL